VRSAEDEQSEEPSQGDHGHTMVYSTSDRISEPLREPDHRRGTARLRYEGKTAVLRSGGGVIGRSRECDVVLSDQNVSRRHAEVRPSGGKWTVKDLGSTNGVLLNGHRVEESQVTDGSEIRLGNTVIIIRITPQSTPDHSEGS